MEGVRARLPDRRSPAGTKSRQAVSFHNKQDRCRGRGRGSGVLPFEHRKEDKSPPHYRLIPPKPPKNSGTSLVVAGCGCRAGGLWASERSSCSTNMDILRLFDNSLSALRFAGFVRFGVLFLFHTPRRFSAHNSCLFQGTSGRRSVWKPRGTFRRLKHHQI